jgi:carbon storage regulator CsrA
MLVLSRRVGEGIVLPTAQLTISVLGISSNRVRLGFSGPPEVSVQRKEIVDRRAVDPYEVSQSAHGGPVAPIRVLIADADECLLESYRTCLEHQGFVVITATSGLECVARLRDSSPDVLVLDPALPWGGGDGVLALMAEEPDVPRVPVIALAVGIDRGGLYRLASFGIDDFHRQPLSGSRLGERIRAVLKRRPDGTLNISSAHCSR